MPRLRGGLKQCFGKIKTFILVRFKVQWEKVREKKGQERPAGASREVGSN